MRKIMYQIVILFIWKQFEVEKNVNIINTMDYMENIWNCIPNKEKHESYLNKITFVTIILRFNLFYITFCNTFDINKNVFIF